jgi:hypothetical protein
LIVVKITQIDAAASWPLPAVVVIPPLAPALRDAKALRRPVSHSRRTAQSQFDETR